MHRVELDPSLDRKVRVEVLAWTDAVVRDDDGAYRDLEDIARAWRGRAEGTSPGQVDGVGEARRLYRDFGVDPTRTRPSSEALLRRALKELPLYNVNNVVDWGNATSLATLLPLGLYDAARIDGDRVQVRVGAPDEEYEGIRKGMVHLTGRLCVADDRGPFGSPTSDSLRTSIRSDTTDLLAVVFAPVGGDPARLTRAADMLDEGFRRHAGATLLDRRRIEP